MKQTCGSCKWRPCGKQQCICEESPRIGENVKRTDPPCKFWAMDMKVTMKMYKKRGK